MFSEILDCVSFVHPKEFDQTAGCRVGSSSGQCFKVSGSSADRVLNASVLRGQQTLLFSDLMQSWVQRNNARYEYTSRRGLSEVGFLCAYLPRPILWLTIAQSWKVLSLQCCVSQFNKLEAYKKAIENQNAYITNELNKSSVSPFLAFREDETLELQANLVRSRYMLEHFKVLGDELN